MKSKSINITFAALFTAIIALLAQISFLTPTVPLTLQILGIVLCGYTLSLKWSLGCVATYIAIGSLGLPVFSSFQGGIQILLGPTGGFIFGFLILTFCCGLSRIFLNRILKILSGFLGLVLCHIIGVLQYSLVSGNSLTASFITASLPFILKDTALLIAAFFLSEFIRTRLKNFKP